MPYSDSATLIKPSRRTKLWRYRSAERLEQILEGEYLHFHRVDDFDDPFEGSIPDVAARIRKENSDPEYIELQKALNRELRKYSFANCWHISDREQASFWEIYGYEDTVAIQTTFDRLTTAIDEAEEYVSAGKLKYMDFYTENMEEVDEKLPETSQTSQWVMLKRESFSFENELRALIQPLPAMTDKEFEEAEYNIVVNGERQKRPVKFHSDKHGTGFMDLRHPPSSLGRNVDVDINALINNIYVSPKASSEFHENITSIAVENGVNRDNVIKSDMASSVIF